MGGDVIRAGSRGGAAGVWTVARGRAGVRWALCRGAALVDDADRVGVHDPAGGGLRSHAVAAQLAGELAIRVLVDPLADQRRATTAGATLELVRALVDPA